MLRATSYFNSASVPNVTRQLLRGSAFNPNVTRIRVAARRQAASRACRITQQPKEWSGASRATLLLGGVRQQFRGQKSVAALAAQLGELLGGLPDSREARKDFRRQERGQVCRYFLSFHGFMRGESPITSSNTVIADTDLLSYNKESDFTKGWERQTPTKQWKAGKEDSRQEVALLTPYFYLKTTLNTLPHSLASNLSEDADLVDSTHLLNFNRAEEGNSPICLSPIVRPIVVSFFLLRDA
ncbi:hypothetical protein BHM03_00017192 [Ensete ventricosum]|nr:hypothetical protein BHM03_00017192 [Ensete ventricosum]